jgi:hypothetical protein
MGTVMRSAPCPRAASEASLSGGALGVSRAGMCPPARPLLRSQACSCRDRWTGLGSSRWGRFCAAALPQGRYPRCPSAAYPS